MIRLIKLALRYPVSIFVVLMGILFFSWLTLRTMKIDIFPKIGVPTIYVAQPYGGLSPEQMEGFVTSYYEYHFLYLTGVKVVESKSIQGAALIKIQFHEGTDLSQAMSEVVGEVARSKAYMPPGTVAPFIIRYDAGNVPVGQLVFTSKKHSVDEMQDMALYKVSPIFATLPGVCSLQPFGGNQKTVVIQLDPDKIRANNLTPDDIAQVIAGTNTITPAGNVSIGNETYIAEQNSVVDDVRELEAVPLKTESGTTLYIRDIAQVYLGSDITTGYALVNGKYSVYLPVTKKSDASTWDVVKSVKSSLPDMRAAVPKDVNITYEFDQVPYIGNAINTLIIEGLLGALLTGFIVLLFLRDVRGAFIVIVTIPLSVLSALICLNLFGQTINTITLGGLALAIGILVDEATVTIENIHHHREMGKNKARAVLDASLEIALPKLLILICILAVFLPALFMSGVPGAMFLPLSLSVGLAMTASFLLSQTLVPVFANWFMKDQKKSSFTKFEKFRLRYKGWLHRGMIYKKRIASLFILVSLLLFFAVFLLIGTDIFPKIDTGQVQFRLRLPAGTRIERTQEVTQKLLHLADSISRNNVEISSAYIGTQPSSYPLDLIYLWTSGPHEAVIKINLKKNSGIAIETFREEMRKSIANYIPGANVSFEPGELTEQVLNLGYDNPVEITVLGKNLEQSRNVAEKLENKLKNINFLRDVQITSPLDYPYINVDIDRVRAGQLGLTVSKIGNSVVEATSSSRFTSPNYWLDANSGISYQVQVQYPPYRMNNIEQLGNVPVGGKLGMPVYLRDVSDLKGNTSQGEYDRINQQRYISITANTHKKDLGSTIKEVNKTIASLGELPRGLKIKVRGQTELLSQITNELMQGLLIAIVGILLLLTINFQSFKLSFSVLSIVPAVVTGSLLLLLITGQTLNLQSYMGIIMAVGVAVSNVILFITKAEQYRKSDHLSDYPVEGAFSRIRPILMTSLAMIAGMLPIALGIGEGGDRTAPLGIAVIGGLLFSTVGTLFFLPMVYAQVTHNQPYVNPSLNPEDTISNMTNESK